MAKKKITPKEVAKKPRKKRKLKPVTPRSRVRSRLRMLFRDSREHQAALKRENSTCQRCGRKQSKAKGREVKVHVHHKNGVSWKDLIDHVYETLLCNPDDLEVLCEECHKKEHEKDGE